MSDALVGSCVEWVMGPLKKSERGVSFSLLRRYKLTFITSQPQCASDTNLTSVLTSHECSSSRSSHTSPHQTVSILSQALSLLTALLGLAPTMTFPMVKRELLSNIYQLHIPHSCLAPRLMLFSHFSLADLQISTITHHTYALTDATIHEDRPLSTAL